jgi:hypothetical protein
MGRFEVILLNSRRVAIAGLAVAAVVVAGPALAQDLCIEEAAGQTLNCTANDVSIALILVEEIIDACEFEGDTAQVILQAQVSAGANERFDIGFYIATDGGDARTGTCERGFLTPVGSPTDEDSGVGPYPDLDGDVCGDITQSATFLRDVNNGQPITIACTRSSEDPSKVEINSCVSWDHQGNSLDCSGVEDTFPGTKSKCNCSTLTIDVPIPAAPSISLTKSPDAQTVTSGDSAAFTVQIENIGNVELDNVAVADDHCTLALDDCTGDTGNDDDATLSEGEVCTYTCTVDNVTADFTNTATVTADDPQNTEVTDSDSANVFVETPAVALDKSPATQEVIQGDSASFIVEVENSGDTELDGGANMTLTDDQCTLVLDDCFFGDANNDDDATFSVGEVCTYTCTVGNVQAGFTNTASVSFAVPELGPVEDTGDVTVVVPGVAIRKNPANQQVAFGGTAAFTVEVENTGEVEYDGTLGDNMTLTDDQCTLVLDDCAGDTNNDDDATFSPGEICTYTCTVSDVEADFTNTATVSIAEPALGPEQATADVTLSEPDPPMTEIPTLSLWSLALLVLLLLGAAVAVLRR